MVTEHISDAINRINNSSIYKNPVYVYTHGRCLEFAVRLKEKTGGIIFYLPNEKHFVLRIGIKYYDATGNVTKQYRNSRKLEYTDIIAV